MIRVVTGGGRYRIVGNGAGVYPFGDGMESGGGGSHGSGRGYSHKHSIGHVISEGKGTGDAPGNLLGIHAGVGRGAWNGIRFFV